MRAEQTPAQLAKKFPLDKFGTEVADKLLAERRRELLAACRQNGEDVRSPLILLRSH